MFIPWTIHPTASIDYHLQNGKISNQCHKIRSEYMNFTHMIRRNGVKLRRNDIYNEIPSWRKACKQYWIRVIFVSLIKTKRYLKTGIVTQFMFFILSFSSDNKDSINWLHLKTISTDFDVKKILDGES